MVFLLLKLKLWNLAATPFWQRQINKDSVAGNRPLAGRPAARLHAVPQSLHAVGCHADPPMAALNKSRDYSRLSGPQRSRGLDFRH
jgi:hypothetical protein